MKETRSKESNLQKTSSSNTIAELMWSLRRQKSRNSLTKIAYRVCSRWFNKLKHESAQLLNPKSIYWLSLSTSYRIYTCLGLVKWACYSAFGNENFLRLHFSIFSRRRNEVAQGKDDSHEPGAFCLSTSFLLSKAIIIIITMCFPCDKWRRIKYKRMLHRAVQRLTSSITWSVCQEWKFN